MAKKKFLEDVKLNPQRFYRLPSDVNRDRRLSDEERIEILEAWEREARAGSIASEETMTPTAEAGQLDQVIQARREVERRMPGKPSAPGDTATGAERQ
jgi:hypothetical protein